MIILIISVLLINMFVFVRAQSAASEIKRNLIAPALGPPKLDSKRYHLDELPSIISAHHFGMPVALASAPMRLLYIEQVLKWPSGLKVFEDVNMASDCLMIPYNEVSEEQWARTMVLTWRWGKPKPMPNPIPGFSPMSDDQWSELLELMRCGQDVGMELIWIDCECLRW